MEVTATDVVQRLSLTPRIDVLCAAVRAASTDGGYRRAVDDLMACARQVELELIALRIAVGELKAASIGNPHFARMPTYVKKLHERLFKAHEWV